MVRAILVRILPREAVVKTSQDRLVKVYTVNLVIIFV